MAEDIFGQVGSQLVETIFSGVIWLFVAIFIASALGFTLWYFFRYKPKFNIRVKIISNRADGKQFILFDKAAILQDWKHKVPIFRIWGMKRDFPVPKYDVLQTTDGGDYIEMFRKSEEEFYFLTPSQIDHRRLIKADGKMYAIADQAQIMVDPEMAFWSIKRKSLNKKMFDTEHILMKILPFLPQIFGGVIMIFVLYILLDHLPGILSELRQLAEILKQSQLASISTGTG